MSDTSEWQQRIERRLDDESLHRRSMQIQMDSLVKTTEDQTEQIDSIRGELHENTKATKALAASTGGIVEAFDNVRGGMKVIEKIGNITKPILAIGSLGTAIGMWWISMKGGK